MRRIKKLCWIVGGCALVVVSLMIGGIAALRWGDAARLQAYDWAYDELEHGDGAERVVELLGDPPEISSRCDGLELYVYRVYPLLDRGPVSATTYTITIDPAQRVALKHRGGRGC